MSTIEQRIEQWEKMAREVPDDMAFFSLGNAYKDADRLEDAEQAFAKAIEMNEEMSRAYQMRGQLLIKLGREDEAETLLTKGYEIAAKRGDVMPQKAIGSLLTEKLGKPLPEVEVEQPEPAEVTGDQVVDARTGQPQPKLDGPPMKGPLGQYIYDHFGQHTWNEWIRQGTKVINELRLDFSNEQHQQIYDQHMYEWLQITPEDVQQYAEGGGKSS